jgi:TPR repeat protein
MTTGAAGSAMEMIAALVLSSADDLFRRDSWPWILFRETAFKLSGHGRYAQTELEELLKSNEPGPIGCLVTAHVLGKTEPRLARTFAERGLARLTPAEFRKDYATLMDTNSIVGALAGNALASLGDLATEQLTALGAMLAPDETALIQQLTQRVRAINQGPANTAAWPALEQYWNHALRRRVETMLGRFLPQVQFLTNSQALYERGLALVSAEGGFQDFGEAAQCFRKAADQGHAGAQLQLGLLSQFGKGMPEDFVGAMRWFREAAKHDEPHAACSIAGLYRDGKGVRQDLDEALKWYRLDAQKDCAIAQVNLGAILEMQLHTEEALKWYRRAAEAGATPAQAKLGNLLSDGFSTTPDYLEACQWLMLAADGGDKSSQLRLRRIKAKLAIEQFKEAVKRAAAVTHRLEEREKKTEQARRSNAGTR